MAPIWAEGIPEDVEDALQTLKLVNADATGPDPDQWDGYPFEREAILRALEGAPAGAVVLSGDVHIGLAKRAARGRPHGRGRVRHDVA